MNYYDIIIFAANDNDFNVSVLNNLQTHKKSNITYSQ